MTYKEALKSARPCHPDLYVILFRSLPVVAFGFEMYFLFLRERKQRKVEK